MKDDKLSPILNKNTWISVQPYIFINNMSTFLNKNFNLYLIHNIFHAHKSGVSEKMRKTKIVVKAKVQKIIP